MEICMQDIFDRARIRRKTEQSRRLAKRARRQGILYTKCNQYIIIYMIP